MTRSSRAILCSAVMLAAMSAAMARPVEAAPAPAVSDQKAATVSTPIDSAPFTLTVSELSTMTFALRHADSADGAQRWSRRTQSILQKSAFDRALAQTFAAVDFSPGTFAVFMLDSLVAFAGPDNVANSARSYRIPADRFRILLRAIRERTPADAGRAGGG